MSNRNLRLTLHDPKLLALYALSKLFAVAAIVFGVLVLLGAQKFTSAVVVSLILAGAFGLWHSLLVRARCAKSSAPRT